MDDDTPTAATQARPSTDYRALLDQKDLDYVLIATPEHWHARMTLDAADAGKHIYCEKPMTYSIEQASLGGTGRIKHMLREVILDLRLITHDFVIGGF